MYRRLSVLPLVVVIAVSSSPAQQGYVDPKGGRIELEHLEQTIHRAIAFGSGQVQDSRYGRYAIAAIIGLSDRFALELDGFAFHRGAFKAPSRDYYDVTFGAGAYARLWERHGTQLSVNAHFHEYIYLDQALAPYNQRADEYRVAISLSRRITVLSQNIDLWGAPILIVDRLFQYPTLDLSRRGTSTGNLGATLGGSMLVRSRVRAFGQMTYANHWQGEWGIGVVL